MPAFKNKKYVSSKIRTPNKSLFTNFTNMFSINSKRNRSNLLIDGPIQMGSILEKNKVEKHKLSNGLTILLLPDIQAPVVSVQTWFKVGSRNEAYNKTGMAHLFEHLMFKETKNIPEGVFSKVMEESGSRDLNAWTWYDQTVYTESVPKVALEMLFYLESDRMVNLILNENQLSAEREVVLNERQFRSEDDSFGKMNEVLMSLAFEKHPYGWPVIGWRKDIESITLEDCMSFYKRYYSPNNAILVVAGDIDKEQTLSLIDKYYGSIPSQNLDILPIPQEPIQKAIKEKSIELPLESEVVEIGFKMPPLRHHDRAALQVLDIILFHGKTSIMERLLVDGEIASSVTSMLPPLQDTNLYEVQVILREGESSNKAIDSLVSSLEKIAKNGISKSDLSRALNKCKLSAYHELKDNNNRANFAGLYEVSAGSFDYGMELFNEIKNIKEEDIQRVANLYFKSENMTVLKATPILKNNTSINSETNQTGSNEEDLIDSLDDSAEFENPLQPLISNIEDSALKEELFLEEEKANLFYKDIIHKLVDQTNYVTDFESKWKKESVILSNGHHLCLIEDYHLPLISFEITIPGGALFESESNEGIANFVGELCLRGTANKKRQEFEDALDDIASAFDISVDVDKCVITGTTISENWHLFSKLFEEAITSPSLLESEFEPLKREFIASHQEIRNDDKSLIDLFFPRFIFKSHPYGRSLSGTYSSISSFSHEDALRISKKLLHGNNWHIGVAGAISKEEATKTFDIISSKIPPYEDIPKIPDISFESNKRSLYLIDKAERTQTQIMIGHPIISSNHHDYPYLALGTTAFGGSSMSTRLMQEVREKRGWSYGVYARIETMRQGGLFSIWFFPSDKQSIQCTNLVIELFEDVKHNGITEEELLYAKRSILNGAGFDEDTAEHSLKNSMRHLWMGTERQKILKTIANASLEDVNKALHNHYCPENLTIAMVCTSLQIENEISNIKNVNYIEKVSYDSI